jgi:hypothetical protein
MQVHIGVPRQPTILLRFMRMEMVQDDVNLAPAVLGKDVVHEIEKLPSLPPRVMAYLELAGGNQQGGKQGTGAISLVAVAESVRHGQPCRNDPELI